MDCVDPADVGPLRAQLGRDREVHSQARAEVGPGLALRHEPRLLVELRGVRIPDHGDTGDTDGGGERDDVVDQRRGHAPPHPVGVGEKIDELDEAVLGHGGREPHDKVRLDGRDAYSPARQRDRGEDQSLRVIDRGDRGGLCWPPGSQVAADQASGVPGQAELLCRRAPQYGWLPPAGLGTWDKLAILCK